MRTNEQAQELDNPDLLEWASTFTSNELSYECLDDLPPHVLMTVLSQVDSSFFEKRESASLSTLQSYSRLELYLEQVLGKTLKRRRYTPSAQNLYSLLLYICVHCQNSKYFISRILELETGTQAGLMQVISQMEKIVISIVEINEVLEKVGELEEENRGLRKQLEEREEEATGLLERIGVIQQEYKELEAECFKYKRDRCEAMRELNLNQFSDYLQLLRDLKGEQKELLKSMKQLEQGNKQLQKDKGQYKEKIIEDSQVITSLNEQLTRFKGMYKSMRLSTSINFQPEQVGFRTDRGRLSIDHLAPLFNVQNVPCRSARSVYDDETVASDEYRRIKHEFRTVREKYDFLKERHGEQGEELKQYKRMLRKYKDRNTQLQEHIDELKCLHSGLRNTLRPYQEVI